MRKIYLIRHGQPEFPGGEIYCIGRADFPLSPEGRRQAEGLGERLRDKKLTVFSSPLRRAYDTALYLSDAPIVIDGLQEMHAGDWDGLSFSEIRRRWPELYEARETDAKVPIPNSEDWQAGQQRFAAAVAEALSRSAGDIAIVAHTTVILSYICLITGSMEYNSYSHRPDYCGCYIVTVNEDGECSL